MKYEFNYKITLLIKIKQIHVNKMWYVWSISYHIKFYLLISVLAGDKIEKNEMGWACGAYGRGERGVQGLGGETGGKETTGETQVYMSG